MLKIVVAWFYFLNYAACKLRV